MIRAMYSRAARNERTQALFREPEFMEDVCDEVSEGGTLYDIAKKHDITYRKLYGFIFSDDARVEMYNTALDARAANINDRVISGILGVTAADVRKIFDEGGDLKNVQSLDDATAATVQSIDIVHGEDGKVTKKVKLHDKVRGLELMGRNQKMFTDKVEHGGVLTLEQLVAESMRKPDVQPA